MDDERRLTIGVLSPLLAGAFFGVILNGIAEEVAASGGRVVAIQTRDAQLGSNYSWSPPPFRTPLGRQRLDGYIAVIDAADDAFLADLKAEGKPVVLLCHHVDALGCPEVGPDNASGVAQSVEHLLGHGHTRIAFAGEQHRGPSHTASERHQAYVRTLEAHGIRSRPSLSFEAPNSLEEGGEAVAQAILRAGVPCTAVVAASDLIASGLVRTLKAFNVKVPDDVAVVGFDDRDFASLLSPSLSTVRQDFGLLGRKAAALAIDMARGVDVASGPHLLSTSFIARESCGCGRPALVLPVPERPQAHDRLLLDLGAVLARPAPEDDPDPGVIAIAQGLRSAFESSLASGQPDEARLRAAAKAAYAYFPQAASAHGVLECAQQYSRGLLAEKGYSPELMALLDRCVLLVSIGLNAAEASRRGVVNTSLQESLREEYHVSLALVGMRGEGVDPKSLSWLGYTDARSACLALWGQNGEPHDDVDLPGEPLSIAGAMGEGVLGRLPLGSRVDASTFPPVEALTTEACRPTDVILVLPVRTASRYWGFLALMGQPEAAAATGGDLYFLWTALLGAALDHDALVEDIRLSEERYALAARAANDGLWDWDVNGGSVFYSPRWKAMLGFEEDEVTSTASEWFSRVHPEDQLNVEGQVAECLEGKRASLEVEHRMLTKQDQYRWVLCRALAIPGVGRRATRLVGSLTDVTDRKQLESRLRQAALYDSLTGLPNRSLFMDRLVQAMTRAKRTPSYQFCVLFIDLDGFKMVNDSLGHMAGDLLLMKVAERLTAQLRQSDTAVRFGGDEFAILLDNVARSDNPTSIVARLQNKLSLPYDLDGRQVVVSATIGHASSVAGYDNPEDMIRDADAAMYTAKASRRASRVNI